ncbi:unnamed protein product [Meloidogyne enterolobii]|uniref:Uncharacterized protein n=1 Tax=Meloidogyne enterolobii TaxID=390850 RepID=A0ACB0Z035_MELEN
MPPPQNRVFNVRKFMSAKLNTPILFFFSNNFFPIFPLFRLLYLNRKNFILVRRHIFSIPKMQKVISLFWGGAFQEYK